MMLAGSETQTLIREAQLVVREVRARSGLAQAWELLQERDADGKATGALPYTDAALAALDTAQANAPDDIGLLHHAAIAHHARAWDFELRTDPRAAAEWALALNLWYRLATSQEFRTGLEAKLLTCDPNADPAPLHEALQTLLDNLLAVHSDFIRQYAEADELQRARTHVETVERTQFPSEAKERFVARVFEMLTGAVPEAKATQAYAPALTAIERFLSLFPQHLTALRLHAEVCKDWAGSLSYQDHWPEIEQLGGRARPFAARIEAHPQLAHDALARTALEELAYVFVDRASDRGAYYLSINSTAPDPALVKRDKGRTAFRFAIEWARLGRRHSPPGSPVSGLLTYSLHFQAIDQRAEAIETMNAELDTSAGVTSKMRVDAALRLYHAAITDLEEALDATPADEDVRGRLQKYRDELVDLEAEKNLILLRGL